MKITELYRTLWVLILAFVMICFFGVKKVWLTCWSAVYTGIRRLTKCLDNLLKSSVQCKPAAFLFVLIPFVVWSSYSQLWICLSERLHKNHFMWMCILNSLRRKFTFPCRDLQLCDGEVQRPIRSINKPLPNYSQGEVF